MLSGVGMGGTMRRSRALEISIATSTKPTTGHTLSLLQASAKALASLVASGTASLEFQEIIY